MIDAWFDFMLSHGKFVAFISAFVSVGLCAASAFMLLFLIPCLFGFSWVQAFSGALGCGIGNGLAHGSFMAWEA